MRVTNKKDLLGKQKFNFPSVYRAKNISEYDSLSDSAYLRAKEDYLIGINFSRLLSIIYGKQIASKIKLVYGIY